MAKLAFFDCDSTLSSIEGIDELARLQGPDVLKEVEDLTNAAMDGHVPLAEVFGRRIDIIQPDQKACDIVSELYKKTVEPYALEVMATLRSRGWTPIILSGGFAPLIRDLADMLSIERVEAVPLMLDDEGSYVGFGRDYPTTRNGGKPEIIKSLLKEYNATESIMVGDGISDLEAHSIVNTFVGFGGYVRRPAVEEQAEHYITCLEQLLTIVSN